MTSNVRSFAGGALWMAVAAILMLATFEPVAVEAVGGAQVAQSSRSGAAAEAAA